MKRRENQPSQRSWTSSKVDFWEESFSLFSFAKCLQKCVFLPFFPKTSSLTWCSCSFILQMNVSFDEYTPFFSRLLLEKERECPAENPRMIPLSVVSPMNVIKDCSFYLLYPSNYIRSETKLLMTLFFSLSQFFFPMFLMCPSSFSLSLSRPTTLPYELLFYAFIPFIPHPRSSFPRDSHFKYRQNGLFGFSWETF
jgi:hypothetical protein